MKNCIALFLLCTISYSALSAQEIIPFDTAHWEINAQGYVLENYHGHDAIYLKQGFATLKDTDFLNGTIEFDIYLTERRSFPGIRFRAYDDSNMESFYFRPHQSGNPDANQATPVMNGLSGWQLYFGPTYSFAYDYNFDAWTHVRIVVNGDRAQIFLDDADKPNLSWELKHPQKSGMIAIGGGLAPMHYANFIVDPNKTDLVEANPIIPERVEGLVSEWTISDKFEEEILNDPSNIPQLIKDRSWDHTVKVEENNAANIAAVTTRYGTPGNTVFAKITIDSQKDQF